MKIKINSRYDGVQKVDALEVFLVNGKHGFRYFLHKSFKPISDMELFSVTEYTSGAVVKFGATEEEAIINSINAVNCHKEVMANVINGAKKEIESYNGKFPCNK